MTIGKPKRKANPFTGRYKPTKKNLAYTALVSQRRADVATAPKQQRKANAAKLDAAVSRAEMAVTRAQAVEGAAQSPNAPTTGAPEGTAPDDGELGAQD